MYLKQVQNCYPYKGRYSKHLYVQHTKNYFISLP